MISGCLQKKLRNPPLHCAIVHNVVGFLWICSFNFVSVLSVGMPSIRPLETLHNSLSLRQLDAFLEYVTATIFKTPCPSPRLRSPLRSNPFVSLATCDKGPSIINVSNWEGREGSKFGKKSHRMVPKNSQHGGGGVKNPKILPTSFMDGHQYGGTMKHSSLLRTFGLNATST